MSQVNDKWRHVEFSVNSYKELKDCYILGGVDEVMVVLEDSMVVVATISASRFVAGIRWGLYDRATCGRCKHPLPSPSYGTAYAGVVSAMLW
jgi:hypothetical protein